MNLGDDGDYLYLGWKGGCLDVYIVNSSISSLKGMHLVVCELDLNEINFKK